MAKSILAEAWSKAMSGGDGIETLMLGLSALERAVQSVLMSRGIYIRGADLVEVLESLNLHQFSNEIRRYRDLLTRCLGMTCDHELVMREIDNMRNLVNTALFMVTHNVPHLGP